MVLANTAITSHHYRFFFVVRTFKMFSLINSQGYNTGLLTIIAVLYIPSSECSGLVTGSLYALTNIPLLAWMSQDSVQTPLWVLIM